VNGAPPPVTLVVDRRGGPGSDLPDLGVAAEHLLIVSGLDDALSALTRPGIGVMVFLSGPTTSLEAAMLSEAARVVGLPFVRVDPPERRPDGTCHVPAGASACAFDAPAVAGVVASALEARDPGRPLVEAHGAVRQLRDTLDAMTRQLARLESRIEVEQLQGPAGAPLPLDTLSAREREVVEKLRTGATNKEIAAVLFLSPHTVGNHLRHIYRKLDVHGRAELLGRLGGGWPACGASAAPRQGVEQGDAAVDRVVVGLVLDQPCVFRRALLGTKHEQPGLAELPGGPLEHPTAHIVLEVDEHIAHHHEVEAPKSRPGVVQVDPAELDHVAHAGVDLEPTADRLQVPAAHPLWQPPADLEGAVDALLRAVQGVGADVRGEHSELPAEQLGEALADQHRDAVDLLAGGARRRPDPKGLLLPSSLHEGGQDLVLEGLEIGPIAKKRGLVGCHGVDNGVCELAAAVPLQIHHQAA
jgi:DNA-binding CsgD family transcriptional regulator